MKKEIICIACPVGCRLTAEWKKEQTPVITGNKCPRGEIYGHEEVISPKRVVTATVRLNSSFLKRLPVTTVSPVEKKEIAALLNRLYSLRIDPPVKRGDIVLKIEDPDISVAAARSVDK